ncbi:MAG: putative manganese transporter [Spirochaetota bacterium]|nr:putative manganese transporter [Spirochaetota bacterium]
MEALIEIIEHTIMISAFVFVIMLVIEYINVLTSGSWQERLMSNRWAQYLIAALLGATPGCLGAFMVVAMYSHRLLSLGALVTAMIATSGDESFVMLAMIPEDVIVVIGALVIIGVVSGIITDLFVKNKHNTYFQKCDGLIEDIPEHCNCYPKGEIISQWMNCSSSRGILAIMVSIIIFLFLSGEIGPEEWNWIRITILITMGISFFIIATVPDHFLEEHLWEHVAKRHLPRIFLWTLGAFIVLHLSAEHFHLEGLIRESSWLTMLFAGITGLIPESGPHMIFITMYAKGIIPLSILIVSSIVQDGHGMLPLLAHSRRDFFLVKIINLIFGLIVGSIALFLGY